MTPARLPDGHHHNLDVIFRYICERFFPEVSGVTICWGRWSGRSRQRSIRFGAYLPEKRLIRIHPALDQHFVPRLFVEFIVYHELLHHVIPPKRVNGRYQIHSPAFRLRERQFPGYAAAMLWRRRSLPRLLTSHRPSR
jgi:hypothetical protein